MSWEETVDLVNLYFEFRTPRPNIFQKIPFDAAVHKSSVIVWNRDISASRNILIKGVATITNTTIPPSLCRSKKTETKSYFQK